MKIGGGFCNSRILKEGGTLSDISVALYKVETINNI